MKKPDLMLKEYSQKLSDDNLKFLTGRLTQRLSNDIAEVVDFYSKSPEMDRWIGSAKTCWEMFDMVDLTQNYIDKEYTKRSNSWS